jgi:hypothetical protein
MSNPEVEVSPAIVRENALRPSSTRAGVGGVGGGTGFVALAQAIGPKTPMGSTILYLAPTISFVVGIVLYYFEAQTSRYLERRLVNSARKTLEAQLDNPRMSAAHKNKIRKMLEELEESVAKAHVERVKLIRVPSRADIPLK